MYAQDNNSLPVWFILSPAPHHISTNSQPFLVGIVSNNDHLPADIPTTDVTTMQTTFQPMSQQHSKKKHQVSPKRATQQAVSIWEDQAAQQSCATSAGFHYNAGIT